MIYFGLGPADRDELLPKALSLLELVAQHKPPLNALIDVGALITGLSNEQVARTLLDLGLPFEAVVFCDRHGGQQLLRRGGVAAAWTSLAMKGLRDLQIYVNI